MSKYRNTTTKIMDSKYRSIKHNLFLATSATYLLLNGTSFAAADLFYPEKAQALISFTDTPPSNTSNFEGEEINTLREQLLDRTRELQEYKSGLFRASLPQDLTKIRELTKKIEDYEKRKPDIEIKAEELEKQLADSFKQIKTLQISAEALSAYIQNQRSLSEQEKNELISKLETYEKDSKLEKERKLNEKLLADLISLQEVLAAYDNRINDLHLNHDRELQDALEDTSMLKFELADSRSLAEKKENELLVARLHEAAIMNDCLTYFKNQHASFKSQIHELNNNRHAFKEIYRKLKEENRRLEEHNHLLFSKNQEERNLIDQQIAEKNVFSSKLIEKEEAISAAILYYEAIIGELDQKQATLQELYGEEKRLTIGLKHEKQHLLALIQEQKENEETLRSSYLLNYAILNQEYVSILTEIDDLKKELNETQINLENLNLDIARVTANYTEKITKENELERAIESFSLIAEHQDHALAEANAAFSMIQAYNQHLEAENTHLKNQLNGLEIAERHFQTQGNAKEIKTNSFPLPGLLKLLKPTHSFGQ